MAKVSELKPNVFVFECNACGCLHSFQTDPEKSPAWQWNADFERPTVTPSIRVRGGENGNDAVAISS